MCWYVGQAMRAQAFRDLVGDFALSPAEEPLSGQMPYLDLVPTRERMIAAKGKFDRLDKQQPAIQPLPSLTQRSGDS